jgi:hypothetical protein
VVSITAEQMTSNNEPDTKGLPLWVTMFIVQTPVSERTGALSRLASVLHISLGSAHGIVRGRRGYGKAASR